ncbi:50S ribosomal protein L19 [Candidatus Kaiserbacteria bacterium RIFCSPHIGHO2_01_FULL_48_10]|uniref:Large ribosomal subunit protein bL19 n=1 Tax=Candidatus Kaiserbacteria bacterium RIFCSPHIGHO2_01_FULL_48_10 TaxID=1798476 RepID=A0A1F6C599_9BACT|nr:MAG: 50S ribosomal protein L19 [Candidatus Kaiserbacteria bacterium RIFCSPHIGHO2_01_FULL_48_10]
MTVRSATTTTSPVNVEERKKLDIRAGDTVRVHQKIVEVKRGKGADKKEKTTKIARTQVFEGLVLAKKHGSEAGATFTVRATLSGIGVEKIFPLYSPNIDKIEIVRRSKVRRAKLYYIRDKVAREMRRGLRKMIEMNVSTESEREAADRASALAVAAAETASAESVVAEAKES